jgi:hypothetical protein
VEEVEILTKLGAELGTKPQPMAMKNGENMGKHQSVFHQLSKHWIFGQKPRPVG